MKEGMNISDSLHKLRISHRMSFSHYKQNTCVSQFKMAARQRNTFSTLVLKIGTTFLTAALRKTGVTARSAEQLPQYQRKERVFILDMFA
jgi:hypothetical protein